MAHMIGETLRGYRVVEKLGAGGMGLVFVGEHEFIGKRAAIKVLLPDLSQDADTVRRFFNEARAATQVRHPGIVEVFDFGYHSDGRAFIVMELLEGESLANRLKRTRRLPTDVCMRLLSQMGGALGAAHAAGIVHRDLKPDNIYIVRDPDVMGGERAKVLDFGIAKLAGDMSAEGLKTRTGYIIGTPRYMAPEQCRGSQVVDHRADLYALGCIAYEMMCGRPPFRQQGLGDLFAAHMFEAPPPPSTIAPSISPVVESAILRLLAKKPDERFPSAEAFVQALNLAGSGHTSITPAPVVHDVWSRPQTRQNTTLSDSIVTHEKTRPRASRRSRWQWGLALGFLIIGGASAAFVSGTNEQAASPGALSTQGGETNTAPPGNIESSAQPAPSSIAAGSSVATPGATAQPTRHQADAPRVALEVSQQGAAKQGKSGAGAGADRARSEGRTAAVISQHETSDDGDMIRTVPSRKDLLNAINGVRPRIWDCDRKRASSGEIRVTMVVEPSGSIGSISVRSAAHNELLGKCVAEVMKQAKFPRSQKGGTFTYPFEF